MMPHRQSDSAAVLVDCTARPAALLRLAVCAVQIELRIELICWMEIKTAGGIYTADPADRSSLNDSVKCR
jgi:hypothetical protein